MKAGDTSLGGPQNGFPKTVWDVLSQARDESVTVRQAGFEELSRRYWKPIYRYARVAWAKSNEDAKDMTQAFFLWLMESKALARYIPERGSFRSYLKGVLKHFIQNKEEALQRLKRGGGHRILTLDGDDAGLREALSGSPDSDPERAFDRAWREDLLAQALDKVKARCQSENQSIKIRVFESYYLSPDPQGSTYGDVARRLGIKVNEVLHALADLRSEVREEIRQELSKVCLQAEDLEDEWHSFLAG